MKTTGIRMALLAALALTLAGCSTTKPKPKPVSEFQPELVRSRIAALVEQHKFQEARDLPVKPLSQNASQPSTRSQIGGFLSKHKSKLSTLSDFIPGGSGSALKATGALIGNDQTQEPESPPPPPPLSPEEIAKAEMIEKVVLPAEAAWTAERIRNLEAQVADALSRGKDEEARQIIYGYGITRQRTVDAVVYLAKCAYLNSRVNPATFARWKQFSAKYVDASIQAGDYPKAIAAAQRIGRAAAYPVGIDGLLDDSAAALGPRPDAQALADSVKDILYSLIAPRAGFPKDDYLVPAADWQALVNRLESLQGLRVPTTGFEPSFEPDWKALERTIDEFRLSLLEDDVSEEDADILSKALLEGLKALVLNERNGLTTLELNNRLRDLESQAQARVLKAIADEIESASAERRRLLDKMWKALVAMMASTIDFSARETAFTAAISDREEPAINRMLGEGARVLRLHRVRGSVTPEQATSLLLASLYMGFDDVANLALALGADINGTGEKDVDKRTPYLLAVQYGFKGSATRILAKADTTIRDANGAGAVHYAVRANDIHRLRDLLSAGADARTPDKDGSTPLMLAARLRNPAMAAMLLAKSDIDATDANGRAAIHFATAAGDIRTLRTLAAASADLKLATKDGDDLLTLACAANAKDVLTCLLDELKLPVGERPVSWCVIHDKVLTLKTLVAHGGTITDRHLAAAVKLALPDMVRYLVEQGCDVNAPEVHKVVEHGPHALQTFSDESLDAPWIDLAGDDTATIATPAHSAVTEVLLYLHSQGYRPATPKGR